MMLLPNFVVKSQNLSQQVRMGWVTIFYNTDNFLRNHYATAQYFVVITCFKDIYYGNSTVFFEEPWYTKLTLLKSNE